MSEMRGHATLITEAVGCGRPTQPITAYTHIYIPSAYYSSHTYIHPVMWSVVVNTASTFALFSNQHALMSTVVL